MPEWRVFVLDAGDYAEEPCLSVVTDDDRQITLTTAGIPADADPDAVLAAQGWRRVGGWEPGVDGRHAPVRRAGRGRPPRGKRVETKLTEDIIGQVDELIGVLGADRSEVVAALVRAGLEVASGAHTPRRAARTTRRRADDPPPPLSSESGGGFVLPDGSGERGSRRL